jgi:tetratricopeptide (TPR) repeat protein
MKIRYGLVLTLAMAFVVSACAGGATSGGTEAAVPAGVPGGEMLQQGERPRQDEDTRAAERALEEAEGSEDEAAARGFYEQALTSAKAAIAADAMNPLPELQAARAALGLGLFPEAGAHFDRAEELRPLYELETEGMRERAWLGLYQDAAPLVNAGDYEEAAAIFENANAIYAKRPEVMITLGQIYSQLREHDKALANFDQADAIIADAETEGVDEETRAQWIEAASDIPLTRASVLSDAGRFEEAADAFRALVAEDPSDVALARSLAAVLVQIGETEEAFQVYEDLMGRPGLTGPEFYNIGVGFYQGSDYARAAEAFGRAATESPNDRDALEMWARSHQIDSAYAAAIPPAERWAELDPNNQNALLILAQSVNQEGDGERAAALIGQIEALEANVLDLQLTRMQGGAQVSGTLTNKLLEAGTQVTLTFTFYDAAGSPIGTATETIAAGEVDQPVSFQVDFTGATAPVGGYGYTFSAG